ncbi:lytic polysaccharide monooxygenase auxiliary activity family 9 protein [Streptomyces sp. C1-1]|uniref:lytic polysaccharide monooxygenase auxiliary activity family 9 protein n=1 Tax=Streptomyces sp. C1-1 TaxID=3231173 RepID=UPI003CFCBFD7
MPRITAHRTALAAAFVTPFLLPLWAAGPAQAHGAPTDPVSRAYACSTDGGANAKSAACRAAVAANGAPFTFWDNLRVADVNGRDRQTIPDGKLCSGGLPAYKGLDLARTDWPATRLKPGATLTMKYASTIPHTGTFKLYLTEQGYDPTKPLTWSELPDRPFATVKDPALTSGAYRITATLPADRTGRQVLYTIWQNSSTTDTYYSCSDVVFPAAGGADTPAAGQRNGGTATAARKNSGSPSPTAEKRRTPTGPAQSTEATPAPSRPDSTPVASTETADSGPSAPLLAGGAAAVLVLTGGAALALRLRRR